MPSVSNFSKVTKKRGQSKKNETKFQIFVLPSEKTTETAFQNFEAPFLTFETPSLRPEAKRHFHFLSFCQLLVAKSSEKKIFP
jgi:hypothetical protein